jgi:hypothetical protein
MKCDTQFLIYRLPQAIFAFCHGEQLDEKIGGILTIRELIDCTSAAAEAKVINLQTLFPLFLEQPLISH